jgi:hypothetical protein
MIQGVSTDAGKPSTLRGGSVTGTSHLDVRASQDEAKPSTPHLSRRERRGDANGGLRDSVSGTLTGVSGKAIYTFKVEPQLRINAVELRDLFACCGLSIRTILHVEGIGAVGFPSLGSLLRDNSGERHLHHTSRGGGCVTGKRQCEVSAPNTSTLSGRRERRPRTQ